MIDFRLQKALDIGAANAVNVSGVDITVEFNNKFDIVFETAGSKTSTTSATRIAASGASIVLVGHVVSETGATEVSLTQISGGLEHPWALDFLPGTEAVVTERPGLLKRIDLNTGNQAEIKGVPKVYHYGQGGLLDVMVACSGRIPIVSVILGTVSGVSALAAGLSDFVILGAEHGQMFMRSPYMIPEIVSGEIDEASLGGAEQHASRSGIACLVADDESDAIDIAAEILSFLPDHTLAEPDKVAGGDPWDRSCKALDDIVPDDSNRPYDMRKVIEEIVDEGRFVELFQDYAENILIGFARLDGHSVGIVANQPTVLAGCLDIDASVKAARFIRTCDSFNVPVVTFVDVPGFLPGTVQEWGGIIRHGAKLLYAYAEATVPKMAVVTRKAYGGAYLAMSCKHLGSDYNVAWPSGELAVMGADGAVSIIHRKELSEANDPETAHK